MSSNDDPTLKVCEVGAEASTATRTVALIGDSHSAMYQAVITEIAEQEGWHLIVMQKGSCPFTHAIRQANAIAARSCVEWNASVAQAIQDHPEIDEIITSASSKNGFETAGDESDFESGVDGYTAAWDAVPDTVQQIVVIRDAPRPREDNLECLTELPDVSAQLDYGVCSLPRNDALLADPAAEAAIRAQSTGDERLSLIDLSDLFCDQEECLVVIGNTTVYRDAHHLTTAFSMSLEPYLRAGLGLDPAP